jgi:hypothetical protein
LIDGALLMATGLLILAGVERPINDYRGRFWEAVPYLLLPSKVVRMA